MLKGGVALLLAVLIQFGVCASALEDAHEPFVATLHLGETTLSQEFVIYGSIENKSKYYVPIVDFAQKMRIPLKKNGNIISGWILTENNILTVNNEAKTATVGTQTHTINHDDIIELYGETYFANTFLEKIMPLQLKFDTLTQVLTIETKTPFPIESQIAREEMLAKSGRGTKNTEKEEILRNTPLEIQPYEMLTIPNIDLSYDMQYNEALKRTRNNLTFSARNHTAKNIFNVVGSTTGGQLSNIQLSMRRNDFIKRPFEHFLNPKQYWVGDILTSPTNLVSNSAGGVGAFVSNIPPGWKIDFNKLYVTGYALPNWSIEIYINNNLFDFSTVSQSGVYSFQEIPLNVGLNTVKLVFYGPYGQRREVVEKVNLDSSLLKKKQFVYEVSALQDKASLVQSASSQNTLQGQNYGIRYYANGRYGVGDKTAIAFGTTSYSINQQGAVSLPQQRNEYLHSSLTTGIGSFMLNTDFAHQTNTGGYAVKISGNTPVFFASDLFISSQSFSEKFTSEIRPQSNEIAVKMQNQGRFTTGHNIFGKYLASIATVNVNTLKNGTNNYNASVRNSVALFQFLNVANVLTIQDNLSLKSSTGNANATLRYGGKLLIRGAVGYVPWYENTGISTSEIRANYTYNKFGILAGYLQNFSETEKNYNAGVSYNNNYFVTSVSLSYSTKSQIGVVFNIASGVTFSGVKPKVTPFNASTTGAIDVHAFLDENQNGAMDFDEKPLEGVGVNISGREIKGTTNKKGRMLITNLNVGNEMLFDLNTGAVPDITMKGGKTARRRVALLSGATHKINLPVIQTTEIDGNLTAKKGEKVIPMGNITVNLIDKQNRVIQTTKSTSDGYYVFTQVPHGTYKVKIPKGDSERYKNYLIEHYE